MDLNFRSALESDIPKLVSMLADDSIGSAREDSSLPISSQYIDAFNSINSDPNNDLVIAEIKQQVAGMMQLTYIPYLTHKGSWRCLIEGVRIDSHFRGKGFGEIMIKWAIQQALEKGCQIVQLTSDKQRPEAIRFYQKLGFKATHEGFKLKIKSHI